MHHAQNEYFGRRQFHEEQTTNVYVCKSLTVCRTSSNDNSQVTFIKDKYVAERDVNLSPNVFRTKLGIFCLLTNTPNCVG